MKFIIYKDGELELPVEVTPDKETVWLRVEEMAELFDRDRSVIQRHIKNIFKEKSKSLFRTFRGSYF